MTHTSPVLHRAAKRLQRKLQDGVVLTSTTLMHPPAEFGPQPRHIGLVQLDDGSKVLAGLSAPLEIGTRVHPRMRLAAVNDEGLRRYDVAYEPIALKPAEAPFPGYILALTGPSGVGKSTVSNLLVNMVSSYAEKVPILTTRERRKGDDGEYRYVSKKVFTDLVQKGELVAMTHIPSETEERWYGYRASDIEKIWKRGKIPVVVTEMHLLVGLANRYGRRSILSFGLLPPGRSKRTRLSHLLRRLRHRGRETEDAIRDRLKNAEKDLDFFRQRSDLFDRILVNEDLDTVLKKLTKHVEGLSEA